MALLPDQLDDFVQGTQPMFERRAWTDISLPLQEYCAVGDAMKRHKKPMRGGTKYSYRVQTANTGNASNTEMFAVDTTAISDVIQTAEVPWRLQTTNYSYDYREEEFQSKPEIILEILKIRRHDALNSLAELMEENLWTAPTSTSDNRPHGIPYWIVKNASTGFNGGNPSGHSDVAGLSASTYTNWRNFTAQYTTVSKTDLIALMRQAYQRCQFKAPNSYSQIENRPSYVLYTTYSVLETFERIAEGQNDKLGFALAPADGKVTFYGVPVKWVPYISYGDGADSQNPIYGINWGAFYPWCRSSVDMKHIRRQAPNQHGVATVHIDCSTNWAMVNRRTSFVLNTA